MEMNNCVEVEPVSSINRKRKNDQQKNVVSEVFKDYCSSTSIHGIGYLGAKDKSLPEKIWWIIVVILSVSCCCYLISRTWIKWKTNPVILSFEQEQTPIWQIPFPAVTICPVNKVQQMEYNYTEMFRNRDKLKDEDLKEFWDISLICNLEQYEISFNCSLNLTDESAISNILSAAPSMSDTFADISWQSKEYQIYDELFAEQITQEGLCFTFNSFSQNDMYTKEINHDIVYINHNIENEAWNLEEGYSLDSTALNDHPRRTAKDGSGSGLRILMYHLKSNTDYICGPMISGYKVILHNPAETPRPTQQYFLVPLNRQVVLTVKPEMTTTSESLRSMSISARKCYFSNEKSLRFFKVYTQSNCRTECNVNVTQHICGCVPFYMPHDKKTPICGFGKMACLFEAEDKILDYEMMEKGVNASSEEMATEAYKIFDSCNCQPSCSNLQFSAETSQSELHTVTSILASGIVDNEYPPEIIRQLKTGILTSTQVDIFFKESQFLALHRSELYGQTDFLANCGGLLGLFMGFSLLSFIEIFYFSTIRLWVKWRNRRKSTS